MNSIYWPVSQYHGGSSHHTHPGRAPGVVVRFARHAAKVDPFPVAKSDLCASGRRADVPFELEAVHADAAKVASVEPTRLCCLHASEFRQRDTSS